MRMRIKVMPACICIAAQVSCCLAYFSFRLASRVAIEMPLLALLLELLDYLD